MKTITIIDDSYIDASLLTNWIVTDKNYRLHKQYNSGVDAVKEVEHIKSDLCIIDVCMPLLNGFDTTLLLLQKGFTGRILIVSHAYREDYLLNSKKYGAHAFCRKDKNIIFYTIEKLGQQDFYFDALHYDNWENITQTNSLHKKDDDERIALINPNFKKILLYSAQGLTAEETGIKMNFKKHTIDQYRCDMLQQLGFRNIAQAVAWAVACHVISQSEALTPPPNSAN